MGLAPGTSIGHYDVTALLGEGGMGQVWQATDTQLNRQVALKILPDAFAADPDRLARFKREAQILASLNHPNIAAIYGIEEAEGTRALVLELVEGPTLADRISKGPIPLDEALPIAKQIAEALEAAHEAGVIHRDLKPANVKVKEDGTVKVLDFGLAKALDPNPDADPSQSPTLTAAATQMGVIMGTAAYMSPEQARGKTVDKRADIWAFGVVLNEMLTGRRAFEGEDVSLTLSAVLQREPAWDLLPAGVPSGLRTYLRQCLEKDPRQRIQAVGDVRLALEGAFDMSARAVVTEQASFWRRPAPIMLATLTAAATAGFLMWNLSLALGDPGSPAVARFALEADPAFPFSRSAAYADLAVTPDGSHVVYLSGGIDRILAVRQIGDLTSTALVENGTRIRAPFAGPDGEWIAFFDDTTIKRVSTGRGPVLTVTEAGEWPRGADWGADGSIVFATREAGTGLFRVSAFGGSPEVLTTPDSEQGELGHWWPTWLPGNRAVLFTIVSDIRAQVETAQVGLLDLETETWSTILPYGSSPRYVPSGHLVYVDRDSLWAVAFDLDQLSVIGSPVALSDEIAVKPNGSVNAVASTNGALWYVRGGLRAGVGTQRRLFWVTREGSAEAVSHEPVALAGFRVSPSGDRVAVEVRDDAWDIWIADLDDPVLTRLTFDSGEDSEPLWTPDGQHIVFTSDRNGSRNLYSRRADGTGEATRLTDGRSAQYATSISPDGRTLLFSEIDPGTLLS